MENIGIDVHKKESQLCIIADTGEVIEQRIRTERGRFAEVLGGRGRAKVLMEASTESEWVARCLEELGHEVVVADPNYAPMYGTRTRRVKTDKRDARALADACASGVYRAAHRMSESRRQVKVRLAVRDALVRQRAYIEVRDDGPGPGASTHRGNQISTRELKERLTLSFGPLAAFALENAPGGGCLARLALPVR
jgi:transposase